MNTLVYYALLLGGIALFIAMPFLAIQQPWTLAITLPIIIVWGVWVLKSYWAWVYSVGRTQGDPAGNSAPLQK